MRAGVRGLVALAGAACLVGQYLAVPMAANAANTAPVPFGLAQFNGYGAGSELQLGALTFGGTTVAQVGQGLSSASTNTAGLTTAINSESGNVVNPVEPSTINAYGSGSGLDLGLATTAAQEQAVLAGKATAMAPPPDFPPPKEIGPLNLSPIVNAQFLRGDASAVYDSDRQTCPLGQPISYGRGDAANVQAASLLPGSVPIVNTAGTTGNTTTANSTSETFLSSNGDGTFGLSSQASEIIAPVTVNLLGIATLQLTIAGATPNSPVVLDAVTTGNGTGGAVKLASNDVINVALGIGSATPTSLPGFPIAVSQLGPNGIHITLSTAMLGTALSGLLGALTGAVQNVPGLGATLAAAVGPNTPLGMAITNLANGLGGSLAPLANLSLGTLDVDATPHAIGGPVNSPPTIVGGTIAAGAIDLVHLNLGLTGTVTGAAIPTVGIANLYVGHLETQAALNAPIICHIPVLKTATPPSLQAGNNFVYDIFVPDPAKLNLLACSLANVDVVDTISDDPGGGNPTFQVLGANDGGKVNQTSTTNATVSWTGLSYKLGQAPIDLKIAVHVPTSSPAGIYLDNANVTATLTGCSTNVGNTNGVTLTGSTQLVGPKVTAAAATPVASQTAAGGTPGALPRTGGQGGLWQPGLGVGLLGLAGGAFALLRRSRRRLSGS